MKEIKHKIKPKFKIWKRIKLSTGFRTADDFRKVLPNKLMTDLNEFVSCGWAYNTLGKSDFAKAMTTADHDAKYELYVLTTAELTKNEKGGTIEKVFAGAARLGFDKCPAWLGSMLRLRYKNQPQRESLFIGMNPINDSNGGPVVFIVEHDNIGQRLLCDCGNSNGFCGGWRRWVFCRRKHRK